MPVSELRIDGVRNLTDLSLELHPRCNVFVGANGAGKTSILEALSYLATGRSFRSGRHREVIQREKGEMTIFVRLSHDGQQHRLGLQRTDSQWVGRVDGDRVSALSELAKQIPWTVFHPGSHELIEGSPEHRRRLLDWTVFHVEHDYLNQWRRYRRALRQRNAALRTGRPVTEAVVWDRELIETAEAINAVRQRIFELYAAEFSSLLPRLTNHLQGVSLQLRRGWDKARSFEKVLTGSVEEDFRAGFTRSGPHRADLVLTDEGGRVSKRLSRGQQKICCLGLLLAQSQLYGKLSEGVLVMALDDLVSELDQTHQEEAIRVAMDQNVQLIVTGVEAPKALEGMAIDHKVFHVEHGRIVSRVAPK